MNQIIAPNAINFNELVKNSNTTLSLNVQTKMIDKFIHVYELPSNK